MEKTILNRMSRQGRVERLIGAPVGTAASTAAPFPAKRRLKARLLVWRKRKVMVFRFPKKPFNRLSKPKNHPILAFKCSIQPLFGMFDRNLLVDYPKKQWHSPVTVCNLPISVSIKQFNFEHKLFIVHEIWFKV